jgi:hypothetical protein
MGRQLDCCLRRSLTAMQHGLASHHFDALIKIHEIMVSDEEAHRTVERGKWYAILSMLPEVAGEQTGSGCLTQEDSSKDRVMTLDKTRTLLKQRRLIRGRCASG